MPKKRKLENLYERPEVHDLLRQISEVPLMKILDDPIVTNIERTIDSSHHEEKTDVSAKYQIEKQFYDSRELAEAPLTKQTANGKTIKAAKVYDLLPYDPD